ncbi:hypothetical protein DFJ77DRAFT_447040 [Powellomyces hirtus]|nr:hypothetical protein DFJ77DRAFT_447040 [Powellomyces hirtus]
MLLFTISAAFLLLASPGAIAAATPAAATSSSFTNYTEVAAKYASLCRTTIESHIPISNCGLISTSFGGLGIGQCKSVCNETTQYYYVNTPGMVSSPPVVIPRRDLLANATAVTYTGDDTESLVRSLVHDRCARQRTNVTQKATSFMDDLPKVGKVLAWCIVEDKETPIEGYPKLEFVNQADVVRDVATPTPTPVAPANGQSVPNGEMRLVINVAGTLVIMLSLLSIV